MNFILNNVTCNTVENADKKNNILKNKKNKKTIILIALFGSERARSANDTLK